MSHPPSDDYEAPINFEELLTPPAPEAPGLTLNPRYAPIPQLPPAPVPPVNPNPNVRAYLGTNVPGYEQLIQVLSDAYRQASSGKGKERHAGEGTPFHEQPMQQIAKRRGIGFILGQADKKSEEAQGMLERGQVDACTNELLGAIVYLSGAIIHIRNNQQ